MTNSAVDTRWWPNGWSGHAIAFHTSCMIIIVERFRGTIFRAKIRMGATDFFQARSIRFFGTENPCGLAFIRTMFRMEILRHRVQKDFSRTNLVRET